MIHFSYQAPEKADRIVKTMKTEFQSCHWSTTHSFFVTHCLISLQFVLLGEEEILLLTFATIFDPLFKNTAKSSP